MAGCMTRGGGLECVHSSAWLAHMIGVERRCIADEQLVVLWTWLLEGYVPVAHTVADLDELEASASNEPDDARSRPELHSVAAARGKRAA
jgi:hypothetical protein